MCSSSKKYSRRCILIFVFISLLIIATFITLFVIFYIRYQNTQSTVLSYPNFVCNNHSCGCPNWKDKDSFISKIVGGADAPPYLYPWLVALTDRHLTNPFCAGFIISSNIVLTAAHCLNDRQANQVQILARIHDLRYFQGERHDIDQWISHPGYRIDNSMHLDDIALIKIRTSFAEDLQPCCLPRASSNSYPQAKTEAVVSGWGKISVIPTSQHSPILQHVVMPIVDNKNRKCRQTITDSKRQLCAGYENFSIDSCAGDSGAPLLVVEHENAEGYFVAAGIVSYGNRQCDASISSGVYTRVSFYLDWISQTITTKLI